jgi:transposase InsO family protein
MEQMKMSRKERERLVVFTKIKNRELSRREGGEVLGLSLRQMHRMFVRFLAQGDRGLLHRLRGGVSPRRAEVTDKARALDLCRGMYRGFGPTLAAEKLGENHGIWASHDTVRRWLREAGLLERTRRGRRRERKERFGQMVQMDGSPHAWFESRGPSCVLMTVIDDATGRRRGWFHEAETLECAMDCFGRWVERFGVPRSLYVDRHSIYRSDREPTAEELREGKSPRTQFGRAMDELGVELIMARSPQAKGRVERSNGVLQDRLVKELRLAGVSGIEQANAWLQSSGYFQRLDEKFAVEAADEVDAHRPMVVVLGDVLCVKDKRAVGLDGCVQWQGRVLQLQEPGKLREVEVWHRANGTLELLGDGRRLTWRELDAAAQERLKQARRRANKRPIVNNKQAKPGPHQRIRLKGSLPPKASSPSVKRGPATSAGKLPNR